MNSAQRVIMLIVSPLCAIVLPCMMKKMPLSCDVTGGSNGVKQTEKCLLPCAQLHTRVASAACLPTSELNENPLNASITFALLTSGRANSKRNITSTLRQPTQPVLANRLYFANTNNQLKANILASRSCRGF